MAYLVRGAISVRCWKRVSIILTREVSSIRGGKVHK